jgi:hypothetical protein
MKLTLFVILCLFIGLSVARAGSRPPITRDMVLVALSSAHISTTPGAKMPLLDRNSRQWYEYVLRNFNLKVNGKHITINIDAE